jgi:hypothetical protein
MNNYFLSEHQRKYYVYPISTHSEKEEKEEDDYHYIKVFSPQVKAEIIINYQITHIPKFELYFDPIQYYKTLSKNSKEYAILYKTPQKFIPFKYYFKSLSPRELPVAVFGAYKYLLKTLSLLKAYEIHYGNFSQYTICFNEKKNPILFDFECSSNFQDEIYSISLSHLKPVEIYIIHYLQSHTGRLSYSNIETICEDFSNNSLLFLSQGEKQDAIQNSIVLFKPFINVPSRTILDYLQKYINTWDIYELNMTFLELSYEFGSYVLEKHKPYMEFFIEHLKKCLVLDPSKRESVEQIRDKFDEIF